MLVDLPEKNVVEMSMGPVFYDRGMVPFRQWALIHYFSEYGGRLIARVLIRGGRLIKALRYCILSCIHVAGLLTKPH